MKPYRSTLLEPGHKESREDKMFTADEIVMIDAVAHCEEIAPASPRIVSIAVHSWHLPIANEIFATTAEDKDRGRPNDRGIHGRRGGGRCGRRRRGPAHRHRPCEDRGGHHRSRRCYRGRGLGARP
jgi:hypothetical protein